jgi:MYND finger
MEGVRATNPLHFRRHFTLSIRSVIAASHYNNTRPSATTALARYFIFPFNYRLQGHRNDVWYRALDNGEPRVLQESRWRRPTGSFNGDLGAYNKWMDIQGRIVSRLSTNDFKRFLDCIEKMKISNQVDAKANEVWKEITDMVLKCSVELQQKIEQDRVIFHAGTRIRIGSNKGSIAFAMAGGFHYGVILDTMAKANKDVRAIETLKPESFQMLCLGCDLDAKHHCGKCKVAYYCGRGCQKNDGARHKKTCGEEDKNSFCLL